MVSLDISLGINISSTTQVFNSKNILFQKLIINTKLNFEKMFKYLVCSICVLISIQQVCLGVPTGVELLANLKDSDFVYDLGKAVPTISGNNTIRQLSVLQFPTLAYTGISYTLFELAPCGINLPHVHPRASELLYV